MYLIVTSLYHCMQPGLEGKEFLYEPGDALGFVCANDSKEVDYLLERYSTFGVILEISCH